MPREIVHWSVAHDVAQRLEGDVPGGPQMSQLLDYCRKFPHALLLGSVAHDAPYYYRMGGTPFEKVSEVLHGRSGQNTFAPMAEAILAASQVPDEHLRGCLMSFMLGMLTHYACDVVFHPVVNYFTGNYYHEDPEKREEARRRHRLFETYLDSYYSGKRDFKNRNLIAVDISGLRSDFARVCEFLDRHFSPAAYVASGASSEMTWDRSFSHFSKLQRLFLSPAWGALAKGLLYLRPQLAPLEVLFSRGRTQKASIFDSPLLFKNPITGEGCEKTVDELLEDAISDSLLLFRRIDEALRDPERHQHALLAYEGKSLSYGVAGGTPDKAVHYCSAGFDLPGLRIAKL